MSDDYMQRIEIRIQRTIDAPVERIYRAWIDPDDLQHWIWASLSHDVWAELDLRVGGAYRIYSRVDGGRHQGEGWSGMCGMFIEVVPNRKLVYTLHWDADVGYDQGDRLALDEVVFVTFAADGSATRLDYLHLGIPDDGQSAAAHRQGVEQSFDLLEQLVSRRH